MKTFQLKAIALCVVALFTALLFSPFALSSEKKSQHESGKGNPQKASLVLVGHGGVPKDFPNLKKFFQLRDKGGEEFEKIEEEMIHWPRTEKNDSYWAGFMKVVGELGTSKAYYSVHAAFNEFCAPTVDEALSEAASRKPDVIVVASVMLTPGGVHSERDIPASVETFSKKNPGVRIVYAWPYDISEVSKFLSAHAAKFVDTKP